MEAALRFQTAPGGGLYGAVWLRSAGVLRRGFYVAALAAAKRSDTFRVGTAYEAFRQDKKAGEFFQQALKLGHYPEALVGLGRLELHQRNLKQAKIHLMTALNLNLPVGEGGANPVELVLPILQQVKLLQDPVLNCRAWIVDLSKTMKPAALANVKLFVYAPTQAEAEAFFKEVLAAMQPGELPPLPGTVTWKRAPREYQPSGPVHPGIQGLFS